jgi:hypothetical protein
MTGSGKRTTLAYLLRGWEERPDDNDLFELTSNTMWRFSLEDPHSGVRRGFASLDALVLALEAQMHVKPRSTEQAGTDPRPGEQIGTSPRPGQRNDEEHSESELTEAREPLKGEG